MELLENPRWEIFIQYLRLMPLTNCICIPSRLEEGLWVGRVKEARGGGGYYKDFLCNELITYSSSGSCFCKRPSYKINMNHNIIIIIINTIVTTTNQIKHMQVGYRILCGIRASVGPHDMTTWGRVRLMLICCGWNLFHVKPVFSLVWIRNNFPLFPSL